MTTWNPRYLTPALVAMAAATIGSTALSQPSNQPARARSFGGPQAPQVISPEVLPDRQIAFRIFAPKAKEVRLAGSDLPGLNQGLAMIQGTNGVWEITVGPIDAGAYRYNFNVDGISVIDPRNPATSESNANTWSLVNVPGSDFMDTKNVPHGAVSSITYYSSSLQRFRRMHIYTPPGYERGENKFPVFYLLHGAFDCDDSWSSVGRAGFILDNLIAAGKAKPMIVVMPAGHTRPFTWGAPIGQSGDEFIKDFLGDIMPHVEKNYRVYTDRQNRAIAGLSMGGAQTLNIAIPKLDQFAYIGVFSSGVFSPPGGGAAPTWEEQQREALDNAKLKEGLKLLWFSTGKDDFLIETTRTTVATLKKHDFNVVYEESTGGHTWPNWRNYLNEFTPQLFRN